MPESQTGGEVITTEIERKFVIDTLPDDLDLSQYEASKISQGYLASDAQAAVRIRQKGTKHYITWKSAPGAHAAERTELEAELTREQFNTLWPGTTGRRVEKTRYRIPYNGLTIELDVFEGAEAGKILAEVEFTSTHAADMFNPPEWFGADVTADKRFGNASIAEHGFPDILA